MRDEIVVYRTKSGFTQQYAGWIAEELECECVPYGSVDTDTLLKYRRVVVGGYVRYEMLDSAKEIGKLMKGLPDAVLFIVGATPMTDRISTGFMMRKTYRQSPYFKFVPHFYFQGGINMDKLDKKERFLLRLMSGIIMSCPFINKKMKEVAKRMLNSADFSNRENICALVEYVKAGR
ncbi:MAG: flavodoxin domain-containing protein [Bacteroidia bacterium]|nr:flavodoxin domain-containing protein [Bacteroidia bacterium]